MLQSDQGEIGTFVFHIQIQSPVRLPPLSSSLLWEFRRKQLYFHVHTNFTQPGDFHQLEFQSKHAEKDFQNIQSKISRTPLNGEDHPSIHPKLNLTFSRPLTARQVQSCYFRQSIIFHVRICLAGKWHSSTNKIKQSCECLQTARN